MTILDDSATEVVGPATWQALSRAHRNRVEPWIAPRLARRSRGETHPVDDFLFDYYSFRPGQLARWHPGHGTIVTGHRRDLAPWSRDPDYRDAATDNTPGVTTSAERLARHHDRLRAARAVLVASAGRPARYGCFGLHEWAMVYRVTPDEVRHRNWSLRLSLDDIADVVDEHGLRCTHFDAFRFYSPAARPLNEYQLTRADQPLTEQPGCLHATMDLYKWASMFSPFIPSELVADTFELARDVREVDMRSSPYDLTVLGLSPIHIELPEGRREFVAAQRGLHDRAASMRDDLLEWFDRLLGTSARLNSSNHRHAPSDHDHLPQRTSPPTPRQDA